MCVAGPRGYLVRVGEHIDDRWAARLGAWTLERHADGTTTLASAQADQAQLHGLLASLRDMNATILSVYATAAQTGTDAR